MSSNTYVYSYLCAIVVLACLDYPVIWTSFRRGGGHGFLPGNRQVGLKAAVSFGKP